MIPMASWAESVPVSWVGANDLTMARENPVIDSQLRAAISKESQNAVIPIWIFFTDKGIFDTSSYAQALNAAESALTPDAYERRIKSRGQKNLLDFRDLPVNERYIDKVLGLGGSYRQSLKWFNAVTINVPVSQIELIAALPFIRYIKEVASCRTDHEVILTPITQNAELSTLNYGPSAGQLNQINIVPAHELGFKGQGVIICMMDVGYRQGHNAFQNIINSGRLLAQYDFINHDFNTDYDPSQDSPSQPDHGTLTWSTLGGEASGSLYGPSYMASFVLAKTEDITSERHIEEDNWAAGAEWADSIGASVISSSLGYRIFDPGQGDYQYSDLDGHTTIVSIAASMAAYNGITVCNAMGNEGNSPGSLIAPADADSILSCGAVRADRILASFSSWGPTYDGRIKPEVCAQGVSTVCANPYDYQGYTSASGTSLSTPLVGGSSGVLLSAHPNWTPMMVREAMMMTSDRFDSPGNDYGWGIMDVSRALYYHPQGDMLISHSPIIFAGINQPIEISATISGGTGAISSAFLYYRIGENGEFAEIPMTTSDNLHFNSQIPAQTGGTIYYYLKAVDINGTYAFNPIGGDAHPFTVTIGSSTFIDSFEDGIIYWQTGGINNFWGLSASDARTGNLGMADSPTTDYRNNTNSWMESTFSLDLSRVSMANFSFYWRGVLQSGHDTVFVEVSSDNGTTWNRMPQVLTGSMTNFTQYTVALGSYIGHNDVRLRLHLVTDATGQSAGLVFDDFQITETRSANIICQPTSIMDTLNSGQNNLRNLIIKNIGGENLFVNLQAIELGALDRKAGDPELPQILNTWLFISPAADTISIGDSLIAVITLNAGAVSPGSYDGQVSIASNDPESPVILIPVALLVQGPCVYIPGDANGNESFNGLDVVYSVSYFKGGPPPPYSCECTPGNSWYVAGDVNSSCNFNGLDVSYMVSYLKGGPAPSPCADCPPGRMFAPPEHPIPTSEHTGPSESAPELNQGGRQSK